MSNYISINLNLLNNKINEIIKLSDVSQTIITKNKINKNIINSDKKVNHYKYKNISFTDYDLTLFNNYNLIDINLYKKICQIDIPNYSISYYLLNTNSLNILNGLYEEGSKKINIEHNKNIFSSKIKRYSEYFGYIEFDNKKISKIIVENKLKVNDYDTAIYMPENTEESFAVNYIFHTHPKTPTIGARFIDGKLYEFPSISDILHFIEHHNFGILLGSIVIAPEGLYIIRKNTFDRNKIKIDYDVFINDIEDMLDECIEYVNYEYRHLLELTEITYDYFYMNVANNFKFINFINKHLIKYDIHIDYYARIKMHETDMWLFPDIMIPIIS